MLDLVKTKIRSLRNSLLGEPAEHLQPAVVAVDAMGRRKALGTILVSGATLLAVGMLQGCTVTTSGTTTTITLNVAKIKNYGQAGLNAVTTVLSIAAISSAIGTSGVAVITAADTALSAALTAFATAAGSTVTISYDDTDWKTRVDSVLTTLEEVASKLDSAIEGAATTVSSSILSDANTALNALQTVISVFKALLGVVSLKPVGASQMTEAQALAILGVS